MTLLAVIDTDGMVSSMLACRMADNNAEALGGPWAYCKVGRKPPEGTIATSIIPDGHQTPDMDQIDRANARVAAKICASPDCARLRPRGVGNGV